MDLSEEERAKLGVVQTETAQLLSLMQQSTPPKEEHKEDATVDVGAFLLKSSMLVNQLQNREGGPSLVDLPNNVVQSKIFMLFNSQELFKFRMVCAEWSDLIKTIWCQVVKDEMLEQVQNLDLLYEKETTAKLLEFKLKYLVQYATLMRNYSLNMNFTDIVTELRRLDEVEENADLEHLGKKLLLITCMIVSPTKIETPLTKADEITPEHLDQASVALMSEDFSELFRNICQMDTIPDISLQAIKIIKSEFIDVLISGREEVARLGNAGRLLGSWIDGILEYTILKHEVVVLRLKNRQVLEKIHHVSQLWPKKKEFIEGAYKILLFSKGQRRFAQATLEVLNEDKGESALVEDPEPIISKHYFDYPMAFTRVMKNWYKQRIAEETEKNKKLQELHDNLLQIRQLQIRQAEMQRISAFQKPGEESSQAELEGKQMAMENEIKDLKQKISVAQDQINETRSTVNAQRQMIAQAKELTKQASTLCTEVSTLRNQLTTIKNEAESFRQEVIAAQENQSSRQQEGEQPNEPNQLNQPTPEEGHQPAIEEQKEVPKDEHPSEPVAQQEPEPQPTPSTEEETKESSPIGPPSQPEGEQKEKPSAALPDTLPESSSVRPPEEEKKEERNPLTSSAAVVNLDVPPTEEHKESSLANDLPQIPSQASNEQTGTNRSQIEREIVNAQRAQGELMGQILSVGGVFSNRAGVTEEKEEESGDDSSSSDDAYDMFCGLEQVPERRRKQLEKKKRKKLKKKPEKLRKQLFEIVLRKRIFITDRFEKIEKLLVNYELATEQQLAEQSSGQVTSERMEEFKSELRAKLGSMVIKNQIYKSMKEESADQLWKLGNSAPEKEDREEEITFSEQLRLDFARQASDDTWYELYKSITNEKEMAEKDQQRMIRRERRRIRRKKKLRKMRLEAIQRTLKVREEYRKRENLPMRSTSVDSYHNYTDREHEKNLLKEQVTLRNQLLAQHQNNENMQNVLMGLAAVRMLLETATGENEQPSEQIGNTPQMRMQAALQAEQFLRAAQSQITEMSAAQQAQIQQRRAAATGGESERVDMAIQTEDNQRPQQEQRQQEDPQRGEPRGNE